MFKISFCDDRMHMVLILFEVIVWFKSCLNACLSKHLTTCVSMMNQCWQSITSAKSSFLPNHWFCVTLSPHHTHNALQQPLEDWPDVCFYITVPACRSGEWIPSMPLANMLKKSVKPPIVLSDLQHVVIQLIMSRHRSGAFHI